MPLDLTKPYEVVEADDKPKFDPSKPFEKVTPAPPSSQSLSAPPIDSEKLSAWNPSILDRAKMVGQNIRESKPVETLLGRTQREISATPSLESAPTTADAGVMGLFSNKTPLVKPYKDPQTALEGAHNLAGQIVDSLASPGGFATAGFGEAPAIVTKTLGTVFGAQGAKMAWDSTKQIFGDQKLNSAQKVEAIGNLILGGLMLAGGAASFKKPTTKPTGGQNAIPERISAPLPLGETPGGGGEVGTRVSTPEKTPVPPPQKAAEVPQAGKEVLTPALIVDGKPVTGGITHREIMRNHLQDANGDAVIQAFADDSKHVFLDQSGKVLNRTEAAKAVGQTGELHSEDFPKQPGTPTYESRDYSPDDLARYKELSEMQRQTPDEQVNNPEYMARFKELSELQKKNGGMPPKQLSKSPQPVPPAAEPVGAKPAQAETGKSRGEDLLPSEKRSSGQQWDSTKVGTRVRWLRESGYVTHDGKLTHQAAKWAGAKWDTLSDAAKNVIGKRVAADFPNVLTRELNVPSPTPAPEQSSPEQLIDGAKVQRTGKDMRVILPNGETNLVPGTSSKAKALADTFDFLKKRQQPTPPAEMAGPGSPSKAQGPDTGGAWQEGNGADVYGIAQRVREARAKAGQVSLPPTGEGIEPAKLVEWGRELLRNGADPEKALAQMEKTKAISVDGDAVTRAYGEALAQAARQIEENPKFGTDSTAYRTAKKALDDWDARTKKMDTIWGNIGRGKQGETDLDTGSFTGIARAVHKVTGEDLTPSESNTAKKIAAGVRQADKAVEPAKVNLQTAIDNLTETGAPRYSDTIIKIAEKIVFNLDKRADAARARIKARAFRFNVGIDPTVLRDVAEIGASHIAHWGLDFAKWSKVMVDEFGDKINPHLKTIFAESQKLVDAEGDKHGANAESVKKAVKRTGGTKAPTDFNEQQKVFQDYESGNPMTPIQVKTLWTRAKSEYIDKGDINMGDTVHKLAEDLGIDAKDVLNGLSQTKQVKRSADDVWQKQRQARMLKQAAKRWIEHSQETWLQKALPTTAKVMFTMKVNLHGTVAMGTHAPLVAATHPIVFGNNFGRMYRLVLSPEYYEMQQSAMSRRPNYTIAQRNGLVNDMSKMEDFNDPQLAQGFPKMAAWFKEQLGRIPIAGKQAQKLMGTGTRGYSVLKILRQDLFDHEWDKLPESQKSDKMAGAISDSVNHITGVTKAGAGKLGQAASYALFAPKLEASRVAVMVSDPIRMANSLSKLGNMTDAEKWFVKNQFKEKAKIFAVGTGLLLANQQLNTLFGDKKKLNGVPVALGGGGWNPMESDFMKFRVAGMNFAWGSPFLTMARLPLRLYQIGAGSGGKTKYLIYPDESMYKTTGSYLRTQASPFLSPIISVITKGDYQDRPLPQIPGYGPPPPIPKRLAKQGVKPYTWPEFLFDIVLPIPIEQAANDIWHSHELTTKPEQDHALTKAFITGIVMGGTGGRLSDDWNKPAPAQPRDPSLR